jgi:hypothetical protein
MNAIQLQLVPPLIAKHVQLALSATQIVVLFTHVRPGKRPVPNATNLRLINPKFEYRNPKQIQNSNAQNSKQKPQTIGSQKGSAEKIFLKPTQAKISVT